MGYNYKSEFFSANVNLYSTNWKDRVDGSSDVVDNVLTIKETTGQSQYHKGVEVDFIANVTKQFRVKGFLSAGDWEYVGEVISRTLDEDRNVKGVPEVVDVDGGKVGDAAQFSIGLGIDYNILDELSIDSDYRFYDNLYSNVSAVKQNLKLPSFGLLDFGVSYRLGLGDEKSKSLHFRANVNNVLDIEYLSELRTNYTAGHEKATGITYKGVDTGNSGYFGLGRTWNVSIRYNF
jgi:outer membrane receptor for ferrienterochelin and colicin